MAYVYPDYPSKAAIKRALVAGETITCKENTPFGPRHVENGSVCVEGPHYPKPHRWYGRVKVKDGKVFKIT